MKYSPHEYQRYATEYIETHSVAAVLLSMGLGKTSITLTALNDLLFDSFEIRKAIVIAPLRVARDTWTAEIEKWDHLNGLIYSVAVGTEAERLAALRRPADIYIINRENVQWLVEASGVPFDYDMVVVDELSSFKNHQSKRFRAMMKVRPKVSRIDRDAQQQRLDGSLGRVPPAGHGTAAWAVYRPVPYPVFLAGQAQWAGGVFLQAPSRGGGTDLPADL